MGEWDCLTYFEKGTYESANYMCNQRRSHLTISFLYCLVFYSVVKVRGGRGLKSFTQVKDD